VIDRSTQLITYGIGEVMLFSPTTSYATTITSATAEQIELSGAQHGQSRGI
jgi:hypothetical protein